MDDQGHRSGPFDFAPFFEQVETFLARCHVPPAETGTADLDGTYATRPGDAPDLYGAADAAYVLWSVGGLEARTTCEGRRAWAERIQGYQDPVSGWFDRSLLDGHGVPHATAMATGALALLDARPASPLRYAEALFASRAQIDAWLDGFRWGQIWTGSHAAGAAAAVLDAPHGLDLPGDWGAQLLDALDDRVDPRTGLWKRARRDRLLRGPTTLDLGGAAHFWWLYDRLGRGIPYPEQAVDATLALQRRTGLWGSRIYGGAIPHCIDFDALHGLRIAWDHCSDAFRSSRRDRLEAVLARYARAAHAVLTPPGAVDRQYQTLHKLVGTVNALAELEILGQGFLGRRLVGVASPLRSALTRVAWQ